VRKLLLIAVVLLPASMARAEDAANCADKLGVSRVVEIDTTGGAEYGAQ